MIPNPLRWQKNTFFNELASMANAPRQIDCQDGNGHSPYRCAAHKQRTSPSEVTIPPLASGVEKPGLLFCSGIDAPKVRAFVSIASKASEGQIACNGIAAMLFRRDVLDFKDQFIELL